MKFYHCKHCGNIVTYVEDHGPRIVCCGEEMDEMIPDTVDASKEKHVPVVLVSASNVTVKVGTVAHPMTAEHYIGWIALQTKAGCQLKMLNHTGAPEAHFALADGDELVAAYAYCNLHGLWKA